MWKSSASKAATGDQSAVAEVPREGPQTSSGRSGDPPSWTPVMNGVLMGVLLRVGRG